MTVNSTAKCSVPNMKSVNLTNNSNREFVVTGDVMSCRVMSYTRQPGRSNTSRKHRSVKNKNETRHVSRDANEINKRTDGTLNINV